MHEMNRVMEEKKEKAKVYPVSASDYKLLEEIGQGTSGLVYRAYCIPFNEYVAIKQMDLEKCNCPLDNVRKEAQTMSLINHPNVVKAHCSFVVSQHLWIVMPYMGGGSCLHIMKATSPEGFEEPVIATILRETLKALEYLHRQGHIHRDVKAGNILIDEAGGVKLGDFGVSAFMFDNGDRQWTRQTFIGTPCWMAPEVLEQLNGYDFKADIWSFGITALELAHGHAPFSKYPPMKVLLMTLQSAAPGLTYDRDRRFSKSFKEMIAMCLVKDPTKRPTAEKLLKHSFFKSAKSGDYIVRHVLEGLPPLWERVKDVKLKDAARLAEKKMPFGEQEERSQNEYKRGVSGWNFDVDDLKTQAALIQDDFVPLKKEEDGGCKGSETASRVASPFLSPHPEESHPSPETVKAEISIDGEECIVRTAIPCGKPPNGAKIKGRFNVFLDNPEVDASNWQEHPEHEECLHEERETEDSKLATIKEILEDHRHPEPEHVISIKTSDDEKDKEHKQEHSRPIQEKGCNGVIEHKHANGAVKTSPGGKEDEKLKPPVVQKKGRFSVTSADVELKDLNTELKDQNKELERHPSVKVKNSIEHELERLPSLKVKGGINPAEHAEVLSPSAASGLRRTSSAQVFSQPSGNIPANVVHLLHSLANQVAQQQELISSILALSNGETGAGSSNQKLNRSASANAVDHGPETEREREYRQQVCELQARYAAALEEMQSMKQRNIQLERQLNAIFNKEEEERIRQEEQAKEDG